MTYTISKEKYSIFLTIMAGIGYKRSKMTRMLFYSFGIVALAFGQAIFMCLKIFEESNLENVSTNESVLDFSILIMTVLFVYGVFYKKIILLFLKIRMTISSASMLEIDEMHENK